ncbi:MAG: hypothetical protein EHM41_20980 [Chloroflexi bacterium]|nr:MAG: hypothetical protein EHM41_20980 [Chloroflexota bacterium]
MTRTLYLQIDYELCQACQLCKAAKACHRKVLIQIDPNESPYLEVDRCRDCRVCVSACPYGAVKQVGGV